MWEQISASSRAFIVDFLGFLTNNVTHSYGWSIIILTILFRIIILPLTFKSIKSMKAMQVLQPKIKELQTKYKDDKERQTREMMALYKEHKINPAGGCLPLLLQMPIFILLFSVLNNPHLNGYMLVNSSFFGMNLTTAAFSRLTGVFLGGLPLTMPGMIDLSFTNIGFFQHTYLYIPTLILAILMAITTIVQQLQMTIDPQQKTQMMLMNVFLIYISLVMPAGVLLYWLCSNLFQVVQQKFTGTNAPPVAQGAGKDAKSALKASAISRKHSPSNSPAHRRPSPKLHRANKTRPRIQLRL